MRTRSVESEKLKLEKENDSCGHHQFKSENPYLATIAWFVLACITLYFNKLVRFDDPISFGAQETGTFALAGNKKPKVRSEPVRCISLAVAGGLEFGMHGI